VELVPAKKAISAGSYFLIDAQSDEMPCAPNLWKKGAIAVGWSLVTDNLEKMLDQKVAEVEGSSKNMRPTDAGATRLMKKLRDAWSQQIRPREIRNDTSGMVEVICGLDTLHQAHGGEEISDVALREPLLNAALCNPGYHAVGSNLLDNEEVLIEVEPGTLELYKFGDSVSCHKSKADKIRVEGKECVATNKSENGYCLNWPDSGDGGTHVGELVGVNPKGSNGDAVELSLGVIRWMSADQPGFLGMGVELLNGLFEPVMLYRKRRGWKSTEVIKCFLQYAESGGSVSLIAPPFYVADDDRYRVVTNNNEMPVDITNILESTDSFVRFQLEKVPEMNLVS
jgi:hypothetical protein